MIQEKDFILILFPKAVLKMKHTLINYEYKLGQGVVVLSLTIFFGSFSTFSNENEPKTKTKNKSNLNHIKLDWILSNLNLKNK